VIPRYEHIEHTADLALRIYGQDTRDLFANVAYAMFSELTDVNLIEPRVHHLVEIDGIDLESLLVNWLNELLYLHETRAEVYSIFDIHELTTHDLQATVHGAHCESINTVIKAATFHNLVIQNISTGYVVTIVFDV